MHSLALARRTPTRSIPQDEAPLELRYIIGSATTKIEGMDGWMDLLVVSVVVCGWDV
jgi:hypothetical protein